MAENNPLKGLSPLSQESPPPPSFNEILYSRGQVALIRHLGEPSFPELAPYPHLRASSLGTTCDMALTISSFEKATFPSGVLHIFETGKALEEPILRWVQEEGYEVRANLGDSLGLLIALGEGYITGHIDALIKAPGEDKWAVADAKTMNARNFALLKEQGTDCSKPNYAVQLDLYSWAYKQLFGDMISDYSYLLAMNKDNSRLYIDRRQNREPPLDRANKLLKGLRDKTLPTPDFHDCTYCNHKKTCSHLRVGLKKLPNFSPACGWRYNNPVITPHRKERFL